MAIFSAHTAGPKARRRGFAAVAVGAACAAALAAGCALASPMRAALNGLGRMIAVPGLPWIDTGIDDDPQQVRIQQHLSIRISPGPPVASPRLILEIEQDERAPRFELRKVGKCLPVATIAGVQSAENNRLLLYMRDGRVVTATLDKSCHAVDFYSGFYVERNPDGQMCIGRDKLQARSGTSCHLRDMRMVVELPPRRFP